MKRRNGSHSRVADMSGGETHQSETAAGGRLTTAQGIPVADAQNSLRAGSRGPALLEDFALREKIFHFDHERIPERVVHARGYGAHGFFETYESLSDITRADLFARPGQRTEAFVRFSTVGGSQGSADLARDVRGFSVKLYTNEGNWDIVGNNIPVFFIQDAIKFPDLIHAVKPEPDRGFPQAQTAHDNFWDFISLMPESIHMALWIMSDRTIPRSFRFMEGFGVHTFRLVNEAGRSTYVKFPWLQSVTWNEALKINGADPDYHRRDLWNSIEMGAFPEWELGLQLFDDTFADKFDFDILDSTKLIPEELVPVRRVGRLVLDRLVDNFFAETEQVAFCTGNVVPGIDFTNDPLLQGRNFSYLDTQLKRLGSPNFTFLPVNAPRCPFSTFQQDGHMAIGNRRGRVNYEPNSYEDADHGPGEASGGYVSFPEPVTGEKQRVRSATFADHYSQARQFYVSQTAVEQRHIAAAFTFELSKVEDPAVRERIVGHLLHVDGQLASKVAAGLGMRELPAPPTPAREPKTDLPPSPALSIALNGPTSFEGRKLGILVSDGAPAKLISGLTRAMKATGATIEVIAPAIFGIEADDGTLIDAQQQLAGGPSVVYDAVVLAFGPTGSQTFAAMPAARDFVADAYAHCKYIGYTDAASDLLKATLGDQPLDEGVVALDGKPSIDAFAEELVNLRVWAREKPNDTTALAPTNGKPKPKAMTKAVPAKVTAKR
jgi:catalase